MEYERIKKCLEVIRKKTDFVPDTAIVLGSGLGDFAKEIKAEAIIEYNDLPDFPVSTVEGHSGKFILGYLGDTPVIAMQGRVHYYEGYSMEDVVMPVRLMSMLGAKTLFLTNAAGGITYDAGTLMLITDHISSFVPSPLRGRNVDELGVRFPDMSEVYDRKLRELVVSVARESGVDIKEGIYLQVSGPNYETPAEIRMYKQLGADAVGMSTVVEAIAARHAGMRVCAISCITNKAAGLSEKELSHDDVKECAVKFSNDLKILNKIIENNNEFKS